LRASHQITACGPRPMTDLNMIRVPLVVSPS
jgi:hypothetical protein